MPTLTIDQSEYRILLEMINLATYAAQFHHRGGREEWLDAFEDLSDKILGEANAMDCRNLIEKDPESGHLIPTESYENASFFKECAEDMVEQCFWEDLVSRLSDRDTARSGSAETLESLSDAERTQRRQLRDEAYWKEFEKNGVENLELIHRTPHG